MRYKVENYKLYCTNQLNTNNPVWYETCDTLTVEEFYMILECLEGKETK